MKHFPIIHQHDTMQCGIACLQMVCKYFGREYTSDSLSNLCFATTEGVSMLGINETANNLGLRTICVKTTTSIFDKSPLPSILHWDQNHFVVLYKVKKGKKFYVADPGKGLVTYNLEEFKQHWISTKSNSEDKGIAMFLETTPTFFTYKMEGEENIKEKRSFRFLFGYVKKYRKYFGQIILGCPAVPHSVHRGCRHQESRYWLCLAYSVGTVDAYNQQNGNRLYPQMVVASHFLTYQHIIGK